MDDAEKLIAAYPKTSACMSCYRFSGRQQRSYVLMGVMFGIVSVIVICMLYNNLSFGVTNQITSLALINDNYALSTLVPPPEILASYGKNVTTYAIMFDAGSTGTRLHVFKFVNNGHDNHLLLNEVFHEIRPGLSFYSSNPVMGANMFNFLLQKAKTTIPQSQWKITPLSLRATAGLRLLPEENATQLLLEVEKVFNKTEFLVLPDSVSIMDGIDEGLQAWITVNYLTGRINRANETFGTLDLGGGSTQITFATNIPHDIPADFKQQLHVFESNYVMYVHSYLGYGLMSARYQMFLQNEDNSGESDSSILFSPCIHPHYSTVWIHKGTNYTISNSYTNHYGFKYCYNSAKTFIKKKIIQPFEITQKQFYLFSYFFDRAVDSKVVNSSGGKVKIQKFLLAANKACANPSKERIFLCMDLCYITALLMEGYGFSNQAEVLLAKKINDVEVSWALGAALNVIEKLEHRQ